MSTATPPADPNAVVQPVAGQAPVQPAVTPTPAATPAAATAPAATPAPTPTDVQPESGSDPIYGDYPENAVLFAVPDGMNHPDQLIQYFDSQAEVDQYLMEQAAKQGKTFERVVVFEAEAAATPAPTPTTADPAATATTAAPAAADVAPVQPAATPAPTTAAPEIPHDVLEAQAAALLLEGQYKGLGEKIKEVTDQREALEKQYGDGDVSDDEYEKKVAALDAQYGSFSKQAEAIEINHAQYKLKVDTYQQMQTMQMQQAFEAELQSFMGKPENAIFNTSKTHADLFKQTLNELDSKPENQALSNAQILQKTRDHLATILILPSAAPAVAPTQAPVQSVAPTPTPAATPAPTPVAKPVDIPITLDQLQTAVPNSIGSDPYAHIRDLQGQAYQDAFNKLSEADREKMLMSFG